MQRPDTNQLAELVEVARGDRPADLLLTGAQLVNVFTGEVYPANLAIYGEQIVGIGDYEARQTVDLSGHFLAPGFLDGHMHLESSMVTPEEYARAVVPRGTTTVIVDPHEIANVKGAPGIQYMLDASRDLPLEVFVMLSSCVPATNLENAGAALTAAEIEAWQDPRILGLAEMMNFPGIVHGDPECLRKVHAAAGRRVDGHAPRLSGKPLCAYVAAGIESDHECTTAEEAREKLRLGMYILLREGSVTRDIEALLPVVTPAALRRCLLCTDDREPVDLIAEGHIDFAIRKAIRLGCDPVTAITMGSLNVAEYFGLKFVGGLAPGYQADLVVLSDLKDVKVERVLKKGRWVAEAGRPMFEVKHHPLDTVCDSVNMQSIAPDAFRIEARGSKAHVIELIPHQIVTGRSLETVSSKGGYVVADTDRDILKLAVVERHKATGNVGLGLVRGFGLKLGALASTVGHDSHNLILVGVDDQDMRKAAEHVAQLGGGLAVVADGEVLADLPMPVGGLMSNRPLDEVRAANQKLIEATQALGGTTPNPFMSLSFLALPVIPTLKLTDIGLVDVDKFARIDLFAD